MELDLRMKRLFEFADDALQAIIGYDIYLRGSVKTSTFGDMFSKIPMQGIPITWSFWRRYSPKELIESMEELFDSIQARTSLIILAATFEAALRSFAVLLKKKRDNSIFKDMDPENCNYKSLLKIVFSFVYSKKESLFGEGKDEQTKKGRQRVPDLCLDIDDARRLRNLFVHNRGIFNEKYKTDTLTIPGKPPGEYSRFLKFREGEPVPFELGLYEPYSKSHIELLHYLHDLIQREYFGYTEGGYFYVGEKKVIKWRRIFGHDTNQDYGSDEVTKRKKG